MKKLALLFLLLLPAAAWATPVPTPPADTVLLRQFLVAVTDTTISDSVLVAHFMCADRLFRRGDEQVAKDVATLRLQLHTLRKYLQTNGELLKRSHLSPFNKAPGKPIFTLRGGNFGAYVLVADQHVLLPLLVRGGRIVSFRIAALSGDGWFHDYCTASP